MILEKIREATSAHNGQLEEAPLPVDPARTVIRSLYIEILHKLYGYYHPIELMLNRFSEINAYLPDYHQRRKSGALADRIRKVSGLFTGPEPCADLPLINSAGKAFGCIYMMEGPMPRTIISALAMKEPGSRSWDSLFKDYTHGHGARWTALQEAITLFSSQHDADDDIISGAKDTFIKFHAWMNQ